MGAWGVEPTENDTAGDWLVEHVIEPATEATDVRRRGFRRRHDEARVAAWLLSTYAKAGGHVLPEDLDGAVEALQTILADEEAALDWNEPQRYLASVREQIIDVRAAKQVEARLGRRTKR